MFVAFDFPQSWLSIESRLTIHVLVKSVSLEHNQAQSKSLRDW
jgi:hypothetical protein